jgi:hypothetical protein
MVARPFVDSPLFRIKDHGPTRAILVSLPAGAWSVTADGWTRTNVYETRNETGLQWLCPVDETGGGRF